MPHTHQIFYNDTMYGAKLNEFVFSNYTNNIYTHLFP